jgi:hypothetical protein
VSTGSASTYACVRIRQAPRAAARFRPRCAPVLAVPMPPRGRVAAPVLAGPPAASWPTVRCADVSRVSVVRVVETSLLLPYARPGSSVPKRIQILAAYAKHRAAWRATVDCSTAIAAVHPVHALRSVPRIPIQSATDRWLSAWSLPVRDKW